MKEYIECGRIVATHGVRGAVKVDSWCDSPSVLAGFDRVYLPASDAGAGYRCYPVRSSFVSGNFVVLTLVGIDDVDAAIPYKGKLVYAHRTQVPVPAGAMLQCDMIGLPVRDAVTGQVYGTLARIDPSPAADLYAVATPDGKEVLLPAVPAFIKEVNPEKGVLITPIPGFFDEI